MLHGMNLKKIYLEDQADRKKLLPKSDFKTLELKERIRLGVPTLKQAKDNVKNFN